MANANNIFKPVILREIRKCGGNLFALPADLSKEKLIEWARGLKAAELHIFEDAAEISGLESPRFSGNASSCCDKWLADSLASFFAEWEKKHPGDITLNLISAAVSDIRFWVKESMESFCFRELSDEFFPDALLDKDHFHFEAIQYNPVFWVAFEMLFQNRYDPSRSVTELAEGFDRHLFDTRFVFEASQELYELQKKRNAA